MKRILFVMLLIVSLTACSSGAGAATGWQRYIDSAEGSKVNLTLIDADDNTRTYFESIIATGLKEQYNITLSITDISQAALIQQLKQNKLDEVSVGSVDLIWLDESLYKSLSGDGLLYRDFKDELQDYTNYISPDSLDATYIGGTKTQRDVIPFNAKQLTYYYNQDMIYDAPEDIHLLNQMIDENPQKFTYPHPKDSVGNAFVRSVILNYVDPSVFMDNTLTENEIYAEIKPALDYLKEIKPKLYNQGASYPESALALSDLFAEEKVLVTMSYDYREGQQKSGDAVFPYGTKPFIFTDKSPATIDYMGIAFNAANKSGAMVVMNHLLSDSVQVAKIKGDNLWGLPPYDYDALSSADIKAINKAFNKSSVIDVDLLIKSRVHDIPSVYHGVIAKLWEREILTQPEQ